MANKREDAPRKETLESLKEKLQAKFKLPENAVDGNGHVKKYVSIMMSVKDFLDLKPIRDQYDNGVQLVKDSLVNTYVDCIADALWSPTNTITLTHDLKIEQGNHRQKAAGCAVANGTLSDSFVFPVNIEAKRDDIEYSVRAYRANSANSNINFKAPLIFGPTPLSVQVHRPIYEALDSVSKHLTPTTIENIALRVGAFFNDNPTLLKDLAQGKSISTMSGYLLYQEKSNPVSNKHWHTVYSDVNVDLRPYQAILANIFQSSISLIDAASQDDCWGFIGRWRKIFMYVVVASAFRREIVVSGRSSDERTSVRALLGRIRNNGKKVKDLLKTFTNYKLNETALLEILGLGQNLK